ncbi:MAG: zinc ribbon domain-containing protein [Ignavibacteriaceae bacterium]|nr:zinc ribbon domain-containing protein [Ignavibacteriaceae bacterium]
MPIYEYKCSKCNKKFDVLHKSTVIQEEVHCPACDSKENKKLFSSFSSTSNNNVSHSDSSCQNGSCSFPAAGCTSGLCGLN